MKYNRFDELPIWKEAVELAKLIYNLTEKKNWVKDFSFKDQIRRAIISVASNIAEGFELNSINEFIRYLRISKASLGEARTQLFISSEIGYTSEEDYKVLETRLNALSKDIGGFIVYLNKFRANKK